MKTAKRTKNIIEKFWIQIRNRIRNLLHLRTDTHQIALGFSIGVFLGIFPTFGLAVVVVTFLALVVRFNVPASIFGMAIANPFLTPFWMFVSYKAGQFITGVFSIKYVRTADDTFLRKLSGLGYEYIIGNTAVSLVCGLLSYFIVFFSIRYFKHKKEHKRHE